MSSQNPSETKVTFQGIGASGQNIGYAVITEQSPKSLQGTELGINNTAVMGFGAIVPPLVTTILHHYSNGTHLTEAAFEKGFLVIPLAFFLALLLLIFGIKETFCRHHLASDEDT